MSVEPIKNTSAIPSIISVAEENFLLKHEPFENNKNIFVSRDQYDSFLCCWNALNSSWGFPSGDFLIHFLPVSRICKRVNHGELFLLKICLLQEKQINFQKI